MPKVNLTAAVQKSDTDSTFILTSISGSGHTASEAMQVIRTTAQQQADAATSGAADKQAAAAALAQ
jgi:hypothetical protein